MIKINLQAQPVEMQLYQVHYRVLVAGLGLFLDQRINQKFFLHLLEVIQTRR